MLDLLKKIGVPATIAAVVATLVTVVPLLFTVDERYAKASEVKEHVKKLEAANEDLRKELAQAVGFQQAMVALIQAGKMPRPVGFTITEEGGMMRVQYTPQPAVVPAPAASAASAPASAPASAASGVPLKKPAANKIERPASWKELAEGLMRQQQRLIKD